MGHSQHTRSKREEFALSSHKDTCEVDYFGIRFCSSWVPSISTVPQELELIFFLVVSGDVGQKIFISDRMHLCLSICFGHAACAAQAITKIARTGHTSCTVKAT